MSFNYKNPISPISVLGNESVSRTDVFGTDFSVLGTGGYMEVYSLNDLIFSVPTGTLGLVEYSGNTIPIQLNIGSGAIFSPNVLTLNSDNISSGRRRIGMLVHVIEENQVYQFQVPNFTTLWNSATGSTGPGGSTVVFSNFGTTIKNNTASGQNLITAWTGSTIEGVSGGTRTNSNWIKYYGTDLAVTGGSFSNITNILTLTNITGGTIPITGFTSFDRAISAFTYNNANTFTIDDNSGNTYNATIDIVTGFTINGNLSVTGDTNVNGLTATTISATTYQNLPADFNTFVTGFTYSPNTFTIADNSGSTFDATINVMTGLTVNGNLNVSGNTNLDGITQIYSSSYQTLPILSVTGTSIDFDFNAMDFTGNLSVYGPLVVTGNTTLNGLTATTISATTYQNLPVTADTFTTGFTYSSNTLTILRNQSLPNLTATINSMTGLTINGNLSVTGNTNVNNLSATTISATTYQNLPVSFDRYVTGFTYSPNTFTITDNSGVTYNATINTVTGLTVNGNLNVTGTTSSSLFSGVTFSGGTYYGDGSNLSGITDYYTTGATFNPITKIGTFTRNDGNTYTLNLSSLTTIDTYVTGFTSSGTSLTISQNEGQPQLTATIPTLSLSGALSSVTFNIATTGSISATTFSGGTFYGNGSGIFNAPYLPLSGGTVTGSTQFTNGLTANTISATTYQNLPVSFDRYVTGFTYSPNTFTIADNSGVTYNATINTMTGLTVNGTLSATTISATTYQNLPVSFDRYVTGFTYSPNTFTIADNSGSTFDATINVVTGLTVNGDFNVSGDTTLDGPVTINITSSSIPSGTTTSILLITGSSIDIDFDLLEIDGDLSVSGNTTLSGVTASTLNVTGDTLLNGLTATTISATTYQNLPIDPDTYVTGFTYSPNTFTITDNSGSTFDATINSVTGLTVNGNLSVTGNTNVNGLSATTISATTYQNLPVSFDRYVTGFTYSPNTFTISDNSGNTFNATINSVTGLTINGNLTVTGTSQLDGGISSLAFTGTTDRLVQVNSGGTFTAVTDVISAYISSGSTAATDLSTTSNWDINGNYIGPAITGTFQGQKWYDSDYYYEAVQDNLFIRLIRG